MGNQSSLIVPVESLKKATITAFKNNSSSCDQTYITNQLNAGYKINASGCTMDLGEVKNVYDGSTNFICLNKQLNDDDITNEFNTALSEDIKQQNSGLALNNNNLYVNASKKLQDIVDTTVSISSINTCMQNKILNQQQEPVEINCSNFGTIKTDGVSNYIYDNTVLDCASDQINKLT